MAINLFEKYDAKLDDLYYTDLTPLEIAVNKADMGAKLNRRDISELRKLFRKVVKGGTDGVD